MNDVPEFMHRAREVYGYAHFVNDAGGSLCEMEDDVIRLLAQHTLVLYMQATAADEKELVARAEQDPSPCITRKPSWMSNWPLTCRNGAWIISPS